ncbi:hypothetical protein [Photobacterium andalusiense]|uniref:Uncharacterized protein n=1 Tax=Photobacterium andalusiense TaxID=2204296 RepID=A0A1Y6MEI3_9GAMM|nr:hypothetical protein [Photobacterium andalusiense]SMY34983.1 hypothetical protein PAND9192_01651 [Photobacterium andalusiense]
MRNTIKTLFFLSAFSPTLIALMIVRWLDYGFDNYCLILLGLFFFGALLFIGIYKAIERKSETINFIVKKVESQDYIIVTFLFAYSMPVIMRSIGIDFNVLFVCVSILSVILWFISSIPTHPLMFLFKYRFYKVESNNSMVYMLISKRVIRTPESIKKVKVISSSMLIEVD